MVCVPADSDMLLASVVQKVLLQYGHQSLLSVKCVVLPSIETKRLIELGAEAFEKKLLDMFQKGEIYSAATVKEKDLLIHELLIKVGKLEAKVEELEKEKGNGRTDENATCANVG